MARADRIDDAIEWAQRGLTEYSDCTWQLPELRDFLAGILRSQGNDAEAVELYWQGFETTPSLSSYRRLLKEGDVEGAWTIATEYGCDNDTWMTLARVREATHPLGSIAVYEREALALIDRKKNHAYRAAVDLLERISVLAYRAGQPERFAVLLERVRTEHRAKRNLKALLDDKAW